MIMHHLWLMLLPFLGLVSVAPAEKGLEFPRYDGKDRVLDINDRNYRKAMNKYSMLCLLYHEPIPDSKELQKKHQMTEMVLEVRASEETGQTGSTGGGQTGRTHRESRRGGQTGSPGGKA